jgi:hypothetical protein
MTLAIDPFHGRENRISEASEEQIALIIDGLNEIIGG